MIQNLTSIGDGILLALDFLYLVATPGEVQALVGRLNHITERKKREIIQEIVETQKFLKKGGTPIASNKNQKKQHFIQRSPYREVSVMSGGFEMDKSVVLLGVELYNHWKQFKEDFRSSYDADGIQDIDIFQYWLLLWLKIMDGIHDFVGNRSSPTSEEKKSIQHFLVQLEKDTKTTIQKDENEFTRTDIIRFLLGSSHARKLTNWERDQFKEERVQKVFDKLTSAMEDQFIHAIPIVLLIDIQYHNRMRIKQKDMKDLMERVSTKNFQPKDAPESKKDFVQLMKRYIQYIIPHHHQPDKKDSPVQFITILDIDTRTSFYNIIKMQQLIYDISKTKNQEIPITIDATHRRVLFDKYFLPYTYGTKGFQVVIDIFFQCGEDAGRNLRRIIYQVFLLILDETMTKDEKMNFYRHELLPQVQSISVNQCVDTKDKEYLEEIKTFFPQLIHRILYVGGVVDDDTDVEENDLESDEMEMLLEFGNMNQTKLEQSREDLQWARRRLNQENQVQQNKALITGIRKDLEQIKDKIRDRHSPRKDFGRKLKAEFINMIRENYNRLDILYRTQMENLTTNMELMKYYEEAETETGKLDEMEKMLKNVSEKRRVYLGEMENYMTQIDNLSFTGLTAEDKSLFEAEMNKILDQYANIFAGDYLYTDYKTIFWKNYLVHYRSDATIWDASLQREGIHTDALMKKYKYRCNQRPTQNVFGEFQKKLYSDYYLELGGITEEECDKIRQIEYRGDEDYMVNHFKPQEYHSVSFLSEIIRWKLGIQKLSSSQQNTIEEYVKRVYQTSSNRETSYIAFLLSIPVGTLLSIKRSGDWSQVQHCVSTETFFASFDKLALFYGFYRGCGMFQFRGENQFVGCQADEEYQRALADSLNRIGSVVSQ
jgi:hypothetical protein